MEPALQELVDSASGIQSIEVVLKFRDTAQSIEGIEPLARFRNIVTCRLNPLSVSQILASQKVEAISAPHVLYQGLPISIEHQERHVSEKHEDAEESFQQNSARGIVVAVLDWGLDFAHPNFLNEDGSTRLLSFWNQCQEPNQDSNSFYGYGRVYSRSEINQALQASEPYKSLDYHPGDFDSLGNGTHGTAVMDIAAGSGQFTGSPQSMASEADLIFVHLASKGTSGRADLGDSVRLLEALDFVSKTAGERPWVANMSLGRMGGHHSGLSLVEEAMDNLLLEKPGRAIVQSTGNYYQAGTHAHARLLTSQQQMLGWNVDAADITPNELEIWYSSSDRFSVKVRSPQNGDTFTAPLGAEQDIKINDTVVGRIYHHSKDSETNDNHINIFLYQKAPAGRWEINLFGERIIDGRFHAWIERDVGKAQNQSRFDEENIVKAYTTGTICNGKHTIAVGAYDANSTRFDIAPFSSSGPTRDDRLKPDIVAPGVSVTTVRSTPKNEKLPQLSVVKKSGTSFAAPHVTGTIALMFEAASRKLTIEETRKLLLSSTSYSTEQDPLRIGSGYLNTIKAIQATKDLLESTDSNSKIESAAKSVQTEHEEILEESNNGKNETHKDFEGFINELEDQRESLILHLSSSESIEGIEDQYTTDIESDLWADKVKSVEVLFSEASVYEKIRKNRRYAKMLGWNRYYSEIFRLLGIIDYTPTEQDFVRAVYLWQANQNGLAADGVIGANTWRRLKRVLGLVTVVSQPKSGKPNIGKIETSVSLMPRGIDVSHHNGIIHWGKVARSGITFVYIKATQGNRYKDSKFLRNWENARENGILCGAYHFLDPNQGTVEAQAKNYLTFVAQADSRLGQLPAALDVEGKWLKKIIRQEGQRDAWKYIHRWCKIVEKATSHRPILYMNYIDVGLMKNNLGRLVDYEWWMSRYRSRYQLPPLPIDGNGRLLWKKWTIWQFSARESIPGIQGEADLNLFNGTQRQLLQWSQEKRAPGKVKTSK